MTVRAAKDRLDKRGEIYLDAEENFRDEKNFAVVITRTGAARLKESGIDDPAGHFKDKIIRATGEVKLVQDIPRIEIDDAKQIQVVPSKDLPKEMSRLLQRIEELGGKSTLGPDDKAFVRIQLGGTKANDGDLVLIGASTDLVELSLAKSSITDAGLPSLARLKKLEALHLADNAITDKGVAAIKDLTQLQLLGLKGTKVTDAGLEQLSGMKKLQWLGLRYTAVTDAGLVHLKNLPQLPGVSLSWCKVTDKGLCDLKALVRMERLLLDHTGVTDAGLENLKDMSELHTLDLGHTKVGDAGIKHLQGLSKLQMLELDGTQVTDAGLAYLAKLSRLQEPGREKTRPICRRGRSPQRIAAAARFFVGRYQDNGCGTCPPEIDARHPAFGPEQHAGHGRGAGSVARFDRPSGHRPARHHGYVEGHCGIKKVRAWPARYPLR